MITDNTSQNVKTNKPLIEVQHLVKNYRLGGSLVRALRDVSLTVYKGEFVAIMGPSGSGKSTFMNILGCLDRPSKGEYILDAIPVGRMSKNELANVRNHKIGFVFQSFNLLPRMTALMNVELPLLYTTLPPHIRRARATKALTLVGLKQKLFSKPSQVSGGQQQRIAIARALVTNPSLILADEPTGNLDSHTSLEIMAILQSLHQQGITIVLVTHEPDIADFCQRQVHFKDGVILEDAVNAYPRQALEELIAQREQVQGAVA